MPFLLAHQGGWDELLWFSVPVLLVMAWVRWAERRAIARHAPEDAPPGSEPDDASSTMPGETRS